MISFATLYSSSKGNSTFVASKKTKILVDAGMAACHIEQAMESIGQSMKDVSAILITHEHQDHIKSAGSLSRRYDIPIYATPKIWETYHRFGNISERNQRKYEYGMTIGEFSFDFFKTFHDAVQPVGLVQNAHGLIFESNHDPEMLRYSRYAPALKARIAGKLGHLSNGDAVAALRQIIGPDTVEVVLAHLSEENNRPELAYETARKGLADLGINDRICLSVAPPDHTSNIIKLP